MSAHNPGRPPKQAAKKRQQLHFSLYDEDIQRLEELTDNRSEFIRQCIAKAWSEQHDGDQTLTLTVPRWLIREVVCLIKERTSPGRAAVVEALVEELFATP